MNVSFSRFSYYELDTDGIFEYSQVEQEDLL
jgi:hypothetical protein